MTAKAPSALIYVQHLFGIGHVARMRRIAASLVAADIRTIIVEGGGESGLAPVPGVETHRLPPVRVDMDDMDTLLHEDGRLFSDEDRERRKDGLVDLLKSRRPDILMVEAFPFGRRQLRFELVPLLEAAKTIGVPVIASSIRDVLRDKRKPGRAEQTVETIERYFDLVLVHGEESTTPLERSFPLAMQFAEKTRYTGLVGPEPPAAPAGHCDVVVSVGGGGFGSDVIETALETALLDAPLRRSWLILAGHNMPAQDYERLGAIAARAPETITFQRNVPNLSAVLKGAGISVSQAGYNTVADILVAGCRAVLVPYVTMKENEQHDRAAAHAAAGRAIYLARRDMTPKGLGAAIQDAASLAAPLPKTLDGGKQTAVILLKELTRKLQGRQPGMVRGEEEP